jgi:hypothetical protein
MKHFIFSILAFFIISSSSSQEAHPNTFACSGLFCAADGLKFDLTDESNRAAIAYPNILDWLQGRVAGLQVYTLRDGTRLAVIRNRPATIFVDEIRMDPSILDFLPVTDIATVTIIKQPFVFNAPGGVIAIYTKPGEEDKD